MFIKKKKIPMLQIALIGFLPSFIKKFYYRLNGYKIGKNVSFGIGSVIIDENLGISRRVKIGFFTIILGDNIIIMKDKSFSFL